MNTYFISDHHFGHRNIIEYEQREFKNIVDMDAEMIKKWNMVVNKDDIVYHLGDFSFYNKEKTSQIVGSLNGRINLIMGNHDRHSVKWYYDCGFNKVYDKPIIYNDFIILSHEPLYTNNILPFVNVHGHLHSKKIEGGYNINMSVELWDYIPISWEKLKKTIDFLQKRNIL